MFQTCHPGLEKMVAPKKNGWSTGLEMLCNATVREALVSQQTDARSQHDLLRGGARPNPTFELDLLFDRHGKRFGGRPHADESN